MLKDILKHGSDFLAGKGVAEPDLLTELCLSSALGRRRLDLFFMLDSDIDLSQKEVFLCNLDRLGKGEPLQYVLGECEFFGRIFKLSPACLIPRPETEILVETVLNHKALSCLPGPDIVDVGAGSGCIAVTIACEMPVARVTAVDISSEALEIAARNAALNGVNDKVLFRRGDLLEGFADASVDAVVANLPYVKSDDLAGLDLNVRDFEPELALDGGVDGLRVIDRLVEQAGLVLKPGAPLFLEVGAGQSGEVAAMLEKTGFKNVATRDDLAGIARIVFAERV